MKISFLKNNNDIIFFLSAINKPAPNNIVVEKSNQSYTVSWNRLNTSHTELKTIAVYWCHGDRRSHFCKVCEQRKPCILENMYCLTRLDFNRLWDNLFVIMLPQYLCSDILLDVVFCILCSSYKEFENTKRVIRIHKSMTDIQHNGQKKKDKRTNNDLP